MTTPAVDRALELGRNALGMTAWQTAYAELKAVESDLPPEGLSSLAEAAWWTAHSDDGFAAAEAAYGRFVAAGDEAGAGRQAAALSREYGIVGQSSISAAWRAKARRHLEGAEGPGERALLMFFDAGELFGSGQPDAAREMAGEAATLAEHHGDATAAAMARMLQGMIEVQSGAVEHGMALLGEAAASVTAGSVDAKAGGAIMCNTIATCWEMGDFAGAAAWTDSTRRWLDRNQVPAYPGICSVRRAEVLTLNGEWNRAMTDLLGARAELERYDVVEYLGEIDYAVGEIHRRRGDLSEAIASFKAANERGRDPQPGYALVAAARGKKHEAIAALARAFTGPGQRLGRSRVLLPLVELQIEVGDVDAARATVTEFESLASACGTAALRAWTVTARAACDAATGSLDEAARALDEAERIWVDLKIPYELASTRVRRAVVRRQQGDRTGAELDFDAARSIFEKLGAKPDLERLEHLAGPVGTVAVRSRAVLVTDIVGSTRLADVLGDASWTKLLNWHDRTLIGLIEAHGGEKIDRTGDGFMTTFVEASDAVACAIEIQRALERQREEHGFAPNVRIGVHIAAMTDVGGSPAGSEVHMAARIGSMAGTDEILISRPVADAVGDSISVVSWRQEHAKGFEQPVEVGALVWRAAGPGEG